MKFKKKILAVVLAAILGVATLAGCSTSSNKAETSEKGAAASTEGGYNLDEVQERELTLGDRMGENHIMGRTQIKFAETVKELSGGKIQYVKFLSGEVETGGNHIKDMYSTGVINSARGQLELLGYYGYDKGAVFGLPYLFDSRDHFWKFADSDLADAILEDINSQGWGLVALDYIEEGARHFFTTKEMDSYEDLAGRKIRVQPSEIYIALVESFGASATPMAWPEVYGALSTGVVDGAENPYSGYSASLLNEVAPYILEDGHIFAGGFLAVGEKLWNDLSGTEKAIFKEAAKVASDYNREENQSDEEELKVKLEEEGVKIITLSDSEKEAIFEMVQPLYEQFAGEHKDLVEEIRSMK